MDGCVSPFIGEGSFVSKLCGGMGARHGACHACPLGHFMNSARGQVTLYMMVSRYGCLVRGMAVSSGSCRCRVELQSAAGWLAQSAAGWLAQSAAGSQQPAGQSSRTGS